MSIITYLLSLFSLDLRTTFITILIGYLVYKLTKFYTQYYRLPPGPFPLPLLGNILLFKTKSHFDDVMRQLTKKYGPVFTLYMGNEPQIMITDPLVARETFRKNEFSGRPSSYFANMFSNEKGSDIVFADYGHTWEALRRVAHAAVQKYSTNERLVNVAVDSVDRTVKKMLTLEGTDKPFSANNYIYLLFLNILANSTFGHSYDFDEPEFKKLLYIIRDFPKEAGSRVLLWEFSPLIRLIDYKMVTKHRQLFSEMIEISEKNFKKHYIDYDQNIERDFCDALISAKNDALREGKESAPYLTDNNLVMAIFDIFFAGTDTSQRTFQWMLLIMLYYREIQNKLRQEVESLIGDRMPTHEDRHRCHYIMAFISEILRFRNVVPTGVFHKAVVTSKIEEHTIPEGMSVFAYQGIVLRNDDNKYWTNSNDFKPERFLNSDGHYMTTRSPAFIPFGVGRRVCLGEKLAIADLFLVLVRFLQSTQKYDLVLENNKGIDVDPNDPNYTPFDYKIMFKTK